MTLLLACRGNNSSHTPFVISEAISRVETASCRQITNPIWIVPNTHGTSTGWLTGFAPERNYMVNNYQNHIQAAEDKKFPFVFSEVPTAIALKNLEPAAYNIMEEKFDEGLTAITNAFGVEYSPLSTSGATNYRMGKIAQNWFSEEVGIRPDIAWYIDVLGVTPSMAEYLDLLDIELMVHERNPQTQNQLYRITSASGATSIVANVKSYAQWRLAYQGTGILPDNIKDHLLNEIMPEINRQEDLPYMWLIGASDYSSTPQDLGRVYEMINVLSEATGREVCLGTSEDFQYSITQALQSGMKLENISTTGLFSYNAFWANLPQIKQEFRDLENYIVSTEIGATLSSLSSDYSYPVNELYEAWWMLLMNADRALLWGAGSDEPFIGEKQWNVRDRTYEGKERIRKIRSEMQGNYIFDPIGWERVGTYEWPDEQYVAKDAICEKSNEINQPLLCKGGVSAFGGSELTISESVRPKFETFTGVVDSAFVRVEFDFESGEIIGIFDKVSDEQVSGISNQIIWMEDELVAEENLSPSDFLSPLDKLTHRGSSRDLPAVIEQSTGPLFTTVRIYNKSENGMEIFRTVRIPKSGNLIEFETQTKNMPDGILLSARFDFTDNINHQLRATPFGFDRDKPRVKRVIEKVKLGYDQIKLGVNETIGPALGWSSHLNSAKIGLAILDRGLLGRQWNDRHVDILLGNTQPSYRGKKNELLSGKPELNYQYAVLIATDENPTTFKRAAREYNFQPFKSGKLDNGFKMSNTLIIDSVYRSKNKVEILAHNGSNKPQDVFMVIPWVHTTASIKGSGYKYDGRLVMAKGSKKTKYEFSLAPQDAFVLSLNTSNEVLDAKILSSWTSFVPESKQSTLDFRDKLLVGHPPE